MQPGKISNNKISDISIKGINGGFVDNSVKLAILTVVSGYLEDENILVHGERFSNTNFLNNFLSYVLNDKRAAPINFDLNIKFDGYKTKDNISSNDYDLFLPYSGGADSTAGLLYALDCGLKVKPIYVAFGQKNEKQEIVAVKKILRKLKIKPTIIRIDINNYIDQEWKRWKMGIIPARNYLFAAIAASLLSKSRNKNSQVWVCAHKEEVDNIHTDKSNRFFESCSKIFSEKYKRSVHVVTPFKNVTKPEIISYWHKHWENKYNIFVEETISCYFGNNCGTCKACINRAIVFTCLGMQIENFKTNPFLDKEGIIKTSYIDKFSSLDNERKLDFLYALHEQKNVLPKELKRFLDLNYKKHQKKVVNRIKLIKKGSHLK